MRTFDKRDSRTWKVVKHGESKEHPSLRRISLAEALRWGMQTDVLIVGPVSPNDARERDTQADGTNTES